MGSLVAQCLDPLGRRSGAGERIVFCEIGRRRHRGSTSCLLDLALGSEDGLEILEELTGSPGLSNAPVVAFSAHDSRRAEAFERGVDGFLARPFAFRDLQQTVAFDT